MNNGRLVDVVENAHLVALVHEADESLHVLRFTKVRPVSVLAMMNRPLDLELVDQQTAIRPTPK